jgi:hypothetical protein
VINQLQVVSYLRAYFSDIKYYRILGKRLEPFTYSSTM